MKDSPKVRAPPIGFLNCRSTWQSCLLDKAFFSQKRNEKGLLVTRKLCSTLSFLFHCAKWSFPCWLDDYYGQRWRRLPVSGQSMLMLEELFPPPTRKRRGRLTAILLEPLLPELHSWLREGRFKLWLSHEMLIRNLCPVNARKREDIRMEGLLVSCRSNDALLAWPTRQGKDQRRGGKCPARTIWSSFLFPITGSWQVFDRRVHAPLQLRSCANQLPFDLPEAEKEEF